MVNEHIHSPIILCHKKMRNYQLNVRIELRKISYFFSSLMRRWEMEVIGLVMEKDSITLEKTFLGSFGTKSDVFFYLRWSGSKGALLTKHKYVPISLHFKVHQTFFIPNSNLVQNSKRKEAHTTVDIWPKHFFDCLH